MIPNCVPFVLVAISFLFPDAPKPLAIKYDTSDGVTIGADYYAPEVEKGKKAPVAILIHMYPVDRKSWSPLVPLLHKAGFAVLAYDIRGKGESVLPANMDLRGKYGKMDAALFTEAWRDAEGAKKLLTKQSECDVSRLVVIGASIGSGIAIDYARREPDVKAVVCLSPYAKIMGLESESHIKECARQAILLISPQKEYSRVMELVTASGGKAKSEMLPGGAQQHGTNMLTEPMYAEHARRMIIEFIGPPVGLAEAKPDEKKGDKANEKKGF